MHKLEIARPERSRGGNWKLEIPAKRDGQALVELLVAFAFASVLLPGLITGLVASREGKAQQIQRLEATGLLREAQEALRVVRETNWSLISTNGTYHPQISGSSFQLVPGQENINGYTRSIVISDTNRDSNGNIVEGSGTNDPSTKKAVISVSWNTPYSSSVTSTIYLTRYLNNTTFTQTTKPDFDAGTHQGTTTTNTSGGEVILGAGGGGDWCAPNLSITALDLPKNGVANAVTAIEGKAFAGTGENSSGVSFANVTISNTDPPVAAIAGTFDGYKTNGIFGEANYAYLATDTNSKEIVIIDLTQIINGKYVEVGYFNAPGNESGESVFVAGNVGYAIVENKLYTFDLSSKSGSRPQLGNVNLVDGSKKVFVVGNYAYIATESTARQLQIIQVSNGGRTLSVVGQADVGSQGGKDVFVNSSETRAYLAAGLSATEKEFFILDISSKTGNRPILGSYESNGMNPKDVTVVTGNKAILVGTGGEEYQAIDIANETAPVRCGGLNINSGVNGVSSVLEQDGDAYSYIITGDASSEFKILEGGPGGQFATSGIFTSSQLDAGSAVAYNRLITNFTEPPNTNLEFQVAGAAAVLGSCTNAAYNFIGPDSTSNTYFATASAIPFINNGQGYVYPAQCFKYKAFFSTSDAGASPILTDVTVNYSP